LERLLHADVVLAEMVFFLAAGEDEVVIHAGAKGSAVFLESVGGGGDGVSRIAWRELAFEERGDAVRMAAP
jgi:hypothetical protein